MMRTRGTPPAIVATVLTGDRQSVLSQLTRRLRYARRFVRPSLLNLAGSKP